MTPLDDLEQALQRAGCDPKRTHSDGGECRCPSPNHPDVDPSASYQVSDNGRHLVHCFGRGCTWAEVRAGFEQYLVTPWRSDDDFEPEPDGETIYDYADADGNLSYQVVKTRHGGRKTFKQRSVDADGKVRSGRGAMNRVERLPYRLPQMLAAVETGEIVYVVEGEKDADAMAREGLTATCNSGGAGKFKTELAEWFRGARVVVVADCDEAGLDHVHAVAEVLADVATSVTLARPPFDIGSKRDVADLLAEGGTVADLVTLDGQPIDLTDPGRRPGDVRSDLWHQTEILAHVRNEAVRFNVCPTAVLHILLVRFASMISHQWRTGRARGLMPGSLNLYAAVIGEPGDGKTKVEAVAHALMPPPDRVGVRPGWFADRVRPGSAAGLVSAYIKEERAPSRKTPAQGSGIPADDEEEPPEGPVMRNNVNVWLDEGSVLFQINNRPSETIVPELASAWVGTTLSTQLRNKIDSRNLPAGSYALGLGMGLQSKLAEPLFGTVDGGLCQRFLFSWARPVKVDYDPDDYADEVEPVEPIPRAVEGWRFPAPRSPRIESDTGNLTIQPVPYCEVALRELHRHEEDPEWVYSDDPLDTHRMFTRCKVAVLLTLLHDEEIVSEPMWQLAEWVVTASAECRNSVQYELEASRAEALERKRAEQIETVRRTTEVVDVDRLKRARSKVEERVRGAGSEGCTRREIAQMANGAYRDALMVALEDLAHEGVVVEASEGRFVHRDHLSKSGGDDHEEW